MPGTIRQSVTLRASPRAIYEALLDSRTHARFTGAPARIGRGVGAKWSAFDGGLSGRNLELVPGQKIVQSWRSSDWPEGVISKVTFRLTPVLGGTRLALAHGGVPSRYRASIARGWRTYYWEPMHAMFRT